MKQLYDKNGMLFKFHENNYTYVYPLYNQINKCLSLPVLGLFKVIKIFYEIGIKNHIAAMVEEGTFD